MPQLDPTWFVSQLFWLMVSMVVLYTLLSWLALPPLTKVLEKRRVTREQDLALAQSLKTEAEKAREEYERALADARLRAQAIFAEVKQAGDKAMEASLAELNRTLQSRLDDADRRINESKQKLWQALMPAIADLVSMAVEKMVEKRPDDKQVKAVLQHVLSQEQ